MKQDMGLFPTKAFNVDYWGHNLHFDYTPYGYNEWRYDWDGHPPQEVHDFAAAIVHALNKRPENYAGLSEEEYLFRLFDIRVIIRRMAFGDQEEP